MSETNASSPASLTATVRGRVQGVGFRAFTQRTARRLGLAGWVCNAPDGTVSLQATGTRDALGRLLEALHRGPPASRVEAVKADWDAPPDDAEQSGFSIRR